MASKKQSAWIDEARSGVRSSGSPGKPVDPDCDRGDWQRSDIDNAAIPSTPKHFSAVKDPPPGVAHATEDAQEVSRVFGLSLHEATDAIMAEKYIICPGFETDAHAVKYDGKHRVCSACRKRKSRRNRKNS